MAKILSAVLGVFMLGAGYAQSLHISGMLGDPTQALGGYVGATVPVLFGVLGGVALFFAFSGEETLELTEEDEVE